MHLNEIPKPLDVPVEVIRYLRQGLSFRGHDDPCKARSQGNFLEFLRVLSNNSHEIKSVVLKNAPENNKL